MVTKVLLDGTRAYGVEFLRDGKAFYANATKEVILSAGSVNTPQLLMLSGIGPRDELEKFNIDVVQDLNVGRNLSDHVAYLAVFFATNVTVGDIDVMAVFNDYVHGSGMLTTGMSITGLGFYQQKLSSKIPSIEVIFFSTLVNNELEAFCKRSIQMTDEAYEAIFGPLKGKFVVGFIPVLEHPKSVGSVTLKSNNPLEFPNIDLNYYSDEGNEDFEQMLLAIKEVFELTETEPFKSIGAEYISKPFPECTSVEHLSDDYWRCALKYLSTTLYHPVGTARMGNDAGSVVDCNFRVNGVSGLRVVDASVGHALSGHTNALAILLGEIAADNVKLQYVN